MESTISEPGNGKRQTDSQNQSFSESLEEEWRVVPGTNGVILASSLGRIKSTNRTVVKKHSSGAIMEQRYKERMHRCPVVNGYRFTHYSVGGKKRTVPVHTLVLEAFAGPRPDGMEGCHYDGNSLNNSISNLRWDTHLENNRDRKRIGNYKSGESHHSTKYSRDFVLKIIRGQIRFSESGLSPSHYYRIKYGLSWRSVYLEEFERKRA